jgi:siroheme decarboxylase
MADLDLRDAEVLEALENDFPVLSTPYAIIGQLVDMSEKEVIKRALRLRQQGILRAIHTRFVPRALGCEIALVIASVGDDGVDRAASVINAHPGVCQNYRRNHEFDLWFTICLPPDSRLGIEQTVHALAAEAGIDRIHILPALKVYKGPGEPANGEDLEPFIPDPDQQKFIRALQEEIPLQPRPFDVLARKRNLSPEELIAFATTQHEAGRIRGIGALTASRRPAFATSVMGVWRVPEERLDEVGPALASEEIVTSCTRRPSAPDWPYNLFTIIQGRSVDECEDAMKHLATSTAVDDYKALFPLHEYKRVKMTLFPEELGEWETPRVSATSRTAAS